MTGSSSDPSVSRALNVIVTGGTKGIGKALAEEFLKQGDNVVICSRSEDRVQEVREGCNGQSMVVVVNPNPGGPDTTIHE